MSVWKSLVVAAVLVLAAFVVTLSGYTCLRVREESANTPAMSREPGRTGAEKENEVMAFRTLSEDAVEVTVRLNGGITNMIFRRAP